MQARRLGQEGRQPEGAVNKRKQSQVLNTQRIPLFSLVHTFLILLDICVSY